VSTIEELLGRKNGGCGLENREYGHRDLSRSSCGTLYAQKLALTSPTSGRRSVDIVGSRTQTTESFSINNLNLLNVLYARLDYSNAISTPLFLSALLKQSINLSNKLSLI
jgi:hypothetical protein